MKYLELASQYDKIVATTKTLEKTKILADFLKTIPTGDLADVVLLLQGRVFPEWDSREIGIGAQLAIKAIAAAYGIPTAEITKAWREIGDLGKVAGQLAKKRRQAVLFKQKLDVQKVISNLRRIAGLVGPGTVGKKVAFLAELLAAASPEEAQYVIRTCLEELRVGVGSGAIRDAIAQAFDISPEIVEGAYNLTTDFGIVAATARKKGESGLKKIEIQVGRPIKVMLAQRVKDMEEGFARVGRPAQLERKYDGFRMQVDKDGDKITIFTRRLENVTKQFPLIAEAARSAIKAKSAILEGETIGYDPKTGRSLPFQMISERIKRKYHIMELAKKVPVELNLFDVLYYNGRSMLQTPFKARRAVLEKIIKPVKRKVVLSEVLVTGDLKKAAAFYKESLAMGHEGIMLKNLDAPYKPGSRVGNMTKLKPVMETLDLVIVGGEWGTGKRAHWLSSFILACRDPETNEYLEVGKMGTGVKEKEAAGVSFSELTKMLEPLVVEQKGRTVKVKPRLVVEVAYEEIQKSPTYASGYALRFPRLLKLRSDRAPEEIDSIERVKELYQTQRGR